MEKNVKMTLETARGFWVDYDDPSKPLIRKWLLENFTEVELTAEVGKKWEECWKPGWYIESYPSGELKLANNCIREEYFRIQFREKRQALSSLAFAQLSHIAASVNEGNNGDKPYVYYTIVCSTTGLVGLQVKEVNYIENTHIRFNRIEDAKRSLVTNNELWRQYWML